MAFFGCFEGYDWTKNAGNTVLWQAQLLATPFPPFHTLIFDHKDLALYDYLTYSIVVEPKIS